MPRRKVLLVGWDAADWKVIHPLIQTGEMPNLQRLIEGGASGQIATLHPPLSPMVWTSIATGKRPYKHGIHGFSEPTPDGLGVRPISNLSRKAKALWNVLNQNRLGSIVIGWWPSHPAEPIDGVMVSDRFHRAWAPFENGWPLPAGAVHPPDVAATLAALRIHPDQIAAQMVEPFVPLAREIDQDRDKRLALLLRTLSECMSMHAAALWLIDNRPWDFFTVYYDAIDHFCHGFMRYHPPRQSWVAERDFEIYRHVVSMAYRFHDRMLGDLLAKASQMTDDTTVMVMSDHGFHSDHLRPPSVPDIPAGPAIEHRDSGILVISGPDIRKGERLRGASVLDVAPTILTLFGLPVGEDFDGKVLSQAFVKGPEVSFIPSWEAAPGADGQHPPHTRYDPFSAHEALRQLADLGYIEPPDENLKITVEKTLRELRYNLGEAYQDDARHAEALAIFKELHAADPGEPRFALRLFVSCDALGMHAEMRQILEDVEAMGEAPRLRLLITEKRYAEALRALELVRPDMPFQVGDIYMRLRRWREAQQVYEKALAIDPDSVSAHLGLCRVALRRRKFEVAAQSALEALDRAPHHPLAHYLLGRALVGMSRYEAAAEAFRAAISLNPNFPEAHLRLAALLEKHPATAESAREHRLLARRMRRRCE